MQTATPRQLQILRLIRDHRIQNGFSPTMQEIGDILGLTKVTVFEHVGALVKKDLLERGDKHKARSLQVSDEFQFPDESSTKLPLVGQIAAGLPLEAIEDNETLDIGDIFTSDEQSFVLRVTGRSMIDEQIRDGDYVICKRTNTANNGDTVVALLEDGEATLKKFYREAGRIRLQPANDEFEPIYATNVSIQGTVIGVIRVL